MPKKLCFLICMPKVCPLVIRSEQHKYKNSYIDISSAKNRGMKWSSESFNQ